MTLPAQMPSLLPEQTPEFIWLFVIARGRAYTRKVTIYAQKFMVGVLLTSQARQVRQTSYLFMELSSTEQDFAVR